MTWAQAAGPALLVVPVGSTEQHGHHLPLSTDTDIAVGLARRLGQEPAGGSPPDAVVAPALNYGASGEHQDFPGTLSIGHAALEEVVVELGRSATATFERIVLISTHGGNAEPVARAVGRLRHERRRVLAWSPAWLGDAHAGRVETSVMLALHPERVRLDRAAAGNRAPVSDLWPALRREGVRAVSPNGVLGDPGGASAQEGRRLLAEAARQLRLAVSRREEDAAALAGVPGASGS